MVDGTAINRVVAQMRRDILTGVIAPGTSLSQVRLAETYKVSRVPIRDALQALAAEGLVDHAPGTTATVRGISIEELQELYEIREAIEPVATKLAVPNVGRAEVLKMRGLLEVMDTNRHPAVWLPANAEFHGAVYMRANRPRMIAMVEQLRKLTDRYLHLHLEVIGNVDHLQNEHVKIFEAVQSGNAEAAAELTKIHLETSHEFILRYLLENAVSEESTAGVSSTKLGFEQLREL